MERLNCSLVTECLLIPVEAYSKQPVNTQLAPTLREKQIWVKMKSASSDHVSCLIEHLTLPGHQHNVIHAQKIQMFVLHWETITLLTEMIWLSISQGILLVAGNIYGWQHGESCWEKRLKPSSHWICWVKQVVHLLHHWSGNGSCRMTASC